VTVESTTVKKPKETKLAGKKRPAAKESSNVVAPPASAPKAPAPVVTPTAIPVTTSAPQSA